MTRILRWLVSASDSGADRLTISAREPNPYASSYLSEVVTCQLPNGKTLQLLCKYSQVRGHDAYGHRGGVPYEAQVYDHLLKRLDLPTPKFFGAQTIADSRETLLVLEFLGEHLPVKYSGDIAVMREAARWLGRFHRANQSHLSHSSLAFLNRHDAAYYLGWARRTSRFAGELREDYPWLETLCRRFEEVVTVILEPPPVIIHGEYYPENIMFSEDAVIPVDWESTAVAMGEIDLASLTEGWAAEFVGEAKAAYKAARWPEGAPKGFERRLEAAQLYWLFRWLGDRPEWTTNEKERPRFQHLQVLGERWRLI